MGLRKRSAKFGSDKWLSVAFHNARVDMHRNRKSGDERKKRLAAVSGKLRGEGIDEKWAEKTLTLMESNGFGLNQFSTRVLPVLRLEMQRQAERQQRVEAERLASSARDERARLERERRKADDRRSDEMARIGAGSRRAILESAKTPVRMTDDPRGPIDAVAISNIARGSVLSAIDADLTRVEQTLASGNSTRRDLIGTIGYSAYLRYPRRGVVACLALVLLEVSAAFVLTVVLAKAFLGEDAAKSAIGIVLLCAPFWALWRFLNRRKPRVRLLHRVAEAGFKVAFAEASDGCGLAPPSFTKGDIPDELRSRITDADRKAVRFPKRPRN